MNWRLIYAQWLKGRARRLKIKAFALDRRAARFFEPVNDVGAIGFGEDAREFDGRPWRPSKTNYPH